MNTEKIIQFLERRGMQLAFLVALTATVGSLYFSEIARFIPCTLCWYQRILMYPLTVIIFIGIIEEDGILPTYVLPFSVVGIVVSAYHYLIQLGLLGNSSTCNIGIPCSARYVSVGGFITIPFMALTAFILLTVLMIGAKRANHLEVLEVN